MIVYHFNSSDIYHMDLKPENLLIRTEKNGKIYLHLNDFGLAKDTKSDYARSTTEVIKGTVEYLAPEILDSKLVKPNISKQDVWSIGVIAYQLCTLRLPFKRERTGGTMMAILNNPHDPITDTLYSDELKDIIDRLLTKDSKLRPSIQELSKVPIIWNAIDLLTKEFEGKLLFKLRNALNLISLIDLPESQYIVSFVYLWGDRLYTEADKTLYMYSMDDLTSPSATYPLGNKCYSALITDNRLYIGSALQLLIF
jgi:serine/threonine protein kinase